MKVFTFIILTEHYPLEIIGTVSGQGFYYRERQGEWWIYEHISDYACVDGKVFANGDVDDGFDCYIPNAIKRILESLDK